MSIIRYLRRLFPITDYVVEDIAARKFISRRRWNVNFSNLEMGKTEYYGKIAELGMLKLVRGYDTYDRRIELGLKKYHNKLSEKFHSHNVDSWALASLVTGRAVVDNENVFRIIPLRFSRRRLHLTCPQKGGVRKKYGGTVCSGFKKGSYVKHERYGIVYVGGGTEKGIALYNPSTGVCDRSNGNPRGYELLFVSPWRTNWVNDVRVIPKTEFEGGHSLRDPAVRAKGDQTKLELYGNPHFTNREKSKKTCLKRYGVDNVAKVESVVTKRVETSIRKYGKAFNYVRPPTFTKEELIELHINQRKTLKEIEKITGTPWEVISYWMKKHNIKTLRIPTRRYNPAIPDFSAKSSGGYTNEDFKKAQKALFNMNAERGTSRESYKDGALGIPTHVLERRYGSWNNFVGFSGLKPGYVALKPVDHARDYFEACKSKGEALSFYFYEKVTGKPATRLKRLFDAGKPYAHLRDELFDVALKLDQWEGFLSKLSS